MSSFSLPDLALCVTPEKAPPTNRRSNGSYSGTDDDNPEKKRLRKKRKV